MKSLTFLALVLILGGSLPIVSQTETDDIVRGKSDAQRDAKKDGMVATADKQHREREKVEAKQHRKTEKVAAKQHRKTEKATRQQAKQAKQSVEPSSQLPALFAIFFLGFAFGAIAMWCWRPRR